MSVQQSIHHNLEQCKKQAQSLLKAHQAGEDEAVARICPA
jgi:hypothetical protein